VSRLGSKFFAELLILATYSPQNSIFNPFNGQFLPLLPSFSASGRSYPIPVDLTLWNHQIEKYPLFHGKKLIFQPMWYNLFAGKQTDDLNKTTERGI